MKTGTVKFFNHTKGFGFIVEEGNEQEHFVHSSGIIDSIKDGDKVEFDLKEGRKGMNAVDVKIVD
jgi:CspA family cold shock protein